MTKTGAYRSPPPKVVAMDGRRPKRAVSDGSTLRGANLASIFLLAVGVVLGALLGLSPLDGGFYDFGTWSVLNLLFAALVTAVWLVSVPPIRGAGRLASAGLLLLTTWCALSLTWAESVDRAWTEANRLGLYTLTFLLALGLARSRVHRHAIMTAATAALALSLAVTFVRLFTSSAPEMFVDFRLQEPVGYINGQAGFLLLALFPLLAAAERSKSWALAGVSAAAAIACGCLLVLTQSRAVPFALAVAGGLLLAALPGRLRRLWLFALVIAGVMLVLPSLLSVYDERAGADAELPTAAIVHGAALASLVSALVGGLVWALVRRMMPRITSPVAVRLATVGALFLSIAAIAAPLAIVGDPIQAASSALKEFTSLGDEPIDEPRFTAAGGYRYDLWRVAVKQFSGAPLNGVGGGNYGATYHLQRKTLQEARQPHSLPLQVLSELGLVGAVLLLVFVGAIFYGGIRRARRDTADLWVFTTALGLFAAWFTHTSVDWLHNLPGLTGIALLGAGVLVAPEQETKVGSWSKRPVLVLPILIAVGALAVLVASTGRQMLADRYLENGRRALGSHPAAALEDATRSLATNPEAVEGYYLKAAALARLANYDGALDALDQAAAREPQNYVPWALLGDLALRRRLPDKARDAYARASALNPLDDSLRALAADPESARK